MRLTASILGATQTGEKNKSVGKMKSARSEILTLAGKLGKFVDEPTSAHAIELQRSMSRTWSALYFELTSDPEHSHAAEVRLFHDQLIKIRDALAQADPAIAMIVTPRLRWHTKLISVLQSSGIDRVGVVIHEQVQRLV